ncbi:MAG: hypothetical protein KAR42_17855 [candidate division Zixibacteria bacterium]|nr:hypothetical protein [candidate division Zixibacteria bacterium]
MTDLEKIEQFVDETIEQSKRDQNYNIKQRLPSIAITAHFSGRLQALDEIEQFINEIKQQ